MPFTPSRETRQRREQVRKLYLEDGLTPKQIHEATGIRMHQIYRDLKALGKTVMEPIKNAVQQQVKDEQAIKEARNYVKESLEKRQKCLTKVEAILDREPVKIKGRDGQEITLDDAPIKLKAAAVYNELRNSFDELLGIRDVSALREVEKVKEEIKRVSERFDRYAAGSASGPEA